MAGGDHSRSNGMQVAQKEIYGDDEGAESTWTRVDIGHRIEGEVLRRLFDLWLPGPPAAVADIGGGNGRWALDLAATGYDVVLADLSAPLVADAGRRARQRGTVPPHRLVADATNLAWADNSFDAALMLGPLYHLADRDDRLACLVEAGRVVRPGGPILIQILHRAAALRQVITFFGGSAGLIDWRHLWRTGVFDETNAPPWYRSSYWHLPDEAEAEVRDAGLEFAAMQGLDGPGAEGQAGLADADSETVHHWADLALEFGRMPELLATCNHLLMLAKAPPA